MRKLMYWAVAVGLLALAGVIIAEQWVRAGAKVQVGQPCGVQDRPSLAEIDHSAFDALLQKYANGQAQVAYGKWKADAADLQALDGYLSRMGCVDLHKPASKEAQLAYWINVYNALTIKGILREYPTSSIRNHTRKIGYNIWKDLLLWVDGNNYSLDDIEHKILRKMGEPRIHFAIVCASIGCPPLWNHAYTAANLDAELSANARRFFAQPSNFRADAANRTVYVSQILQWYGTDFAPTPAEQMKVLRPYFPNPDSLRWIDSGSVRYLEYNWALNDQQPASR